MFLVVSNGQKDHNIGTLFGIYWETLGKSSERCSRRDKRVSVSSH